MSAIFTLCLALAAFRLASIFRPLRNLAARQQLTLKGSHLGWTDFAGQYTPAELPHIVSMLRSWIACSSDERFNEHLSSRIGELRQRMAALGVPTAARA